jgi:sugar phosphate isomerase/epimerase
MKLTLVRHLWGVDLSGGYAALLARWRAVGYTALEGSHRHAPDPAELRRVLRAEGLRWVPSVYSNMFTPDGSVAEHFHSLQTQIEECLDAQPWFFNAHTGSDSWSLAQAQDFYGQTRQLEAKYGITLAHETHRRRVFANPWMTRAVLTTVPGLRLTCDFSHWVCIAERLLEDCGEIIALAARHCHHVHARVGFEQGPQVPDPRVPLYAPQLAAHEAWWSQIWAAQRAHGMAESALTPEFGPPPYMPVLPATGEPVADLADICDWMAQRQAQRFETAKPRSLSRKIK